MTRTMQAASIAAAVAIGLCAVLVLGQGAPQKPVRVQEMHADGGYGVTSLSDLWKQAQVIAEVRIGTPRPDQLRSDVSQGDLPPVLSYDSDVMTVLKADTHISERTTSITLSRIGGRVDRGNYIAEYRDSSFPPFIPQNTYIVFLKRDDAGRYWPVTANADSVYEINGDDVRAISKNAAAQEIARMSRADLLAALRAQKAGE